MYVGNNPADKTSLYTHQRACTPFICAGFSNNTVYTTLCITGHPTETSVLYTVLYTTAIPIFLYPDNKRYAPLGAGRIYVLGTIYKGEVHKMRGSMHF